MVSGSLCPTSCLALVKRYLSDCVVNSHVKGVLFFTEKGKKVSEKIGSNLDHTLFYVKEKKVLFSMKYAHCVTLFTAQDEDIRRSWPLAVCGANSVFITSPEVPENCMHGRCHF